MGNQNGAKSCRCVVLLHCPPRLVIKHRPMKWLLNFFTVLFFTISCFQAKAQKVDSIYFNLYTDSLKKGTFNYINVEGVLSDGRIIPLDSSTIIFRSSIGKFSANSLWLDPDLKADRIEVTVVLRANPKLSRVITIYVKKKENTERLKTIDEIFGKKKKNQI